MAQAKKLPSGSWRVLVYVGKENGKRKYKSFTSDDKWEAEYQASQFARQRKEKKNILNVTVREAITRYVDSKEGVLSPSTIRGYRNIQNNNFEELQSVKLRDLTNEVIQRQLAVEASTHSAKTVANMCGLLTASLKMFYPDFRVNVSLPRRKERSPSVPLDGQIKALLKLAEGTDVELPIMLAAMGSLRAGEIAALTVSDIRKGGVQVQRTMVRNQKQKWEIKDLPKTKAGIRVSPLPVPVMEKLKRAATGKEKNDRLFELNPQGIYKHYAQLRDQCGMERCRFHDLRHYYASMAHLLGVPDQYIMLNGGWKDKGTLTKIYQHAQEDYEEAENKKITDHFSKLLGISPDEK